MLQRIKELEERIETQKRQIKELEEKVKQTNVGGWGAGLAWHPDIRTQAEGWPAG